jgi:N-acetylmuramoyl-L-alanine amidase
MPRPINLIVVHCSATANGDGLFSGVGGKPGLKTAADRIDEMHKLRGFKRDGAARARFNPGLGSIGYHFVIACNGALFTGRSLDEPGAHVAGHNAASVGICLTGTSAFTPEQFRALEALLRQLNTSLHVPLQAPRRVNLVGRAGTTLIDGVCGHRDLSPDLNGDGRVTSNEWLKTCPGFDVAGYLANQFIPPKAALLIGGAHA